MHDVGEKRAIAKSENNLVHAELLKLVMNSVYGRFIMNMRKQTMMKLNL